MRGSILWNEDCIAVVRNGLIIIFHRVTIGLIAIFKIIEIPSKIVMWKAIITCRYDIVLDYCRSVRMVVMMTGQVMDIGLFYRKCICQQTHMFLK